jgi:hypothetical protein
MKKSLTAAFIAAGLSLHAFAQAPQFTISTVAGNGTAGFSGDGGPATSAEFHGPFGVAIDGSGNLYVVDFSNERIRRISTNGTITTYAGTGVQGFNGDGGPAASAELSRPSRDWVDGSGNLLFTDPGNSRVRKVTPGGTISTIAGNGTAAEGGNGGPATSASLYYPENVITDSNGNIYISDGGGNTIRKISNGVITKIAGDGSAGYSGDGGMATAASLNNPLGLMLDGSGNLYIADNGNSRIRKVANGIITTIAGNGTKAFSGDGGPATSAELANITGLQFDAAGNLYMTDGSRIRVILTSGIIETVAGTGTAGYSGDGGLALDAELNSPLAIAMSPSGGIYIADSFNNRVRLLTPAVQSSTTFNTVLPQLAFGGGWYTALYFTNLNGSPVSFTVNFVAGDGTALDIPALGSSTQVNLAARGTTIIEAPNTGNLVEGYVTAQLPSGVTGYGVFRFTAQGAPAGQEAVVPLSGVTATTSTMIFDETSYVTGVAVVGIASAAVTVNVTAYGTGGNTIGTGTIQLGANGKTAVLLKDIPGLGGVAGQRGSVDFSVTGANVAALGIRYNGQAFTSIPTSNR